MNGFPRASFSVPCLVPGSVSRKELVVEVVGIGSVHTLHSVNGNGNGTVNGNGNVSGKLVESGICWVKFPCVFSQGRNRRQVPWHQSWE